ncbi:MAG: 6-phosphofructokinase [Chloroflexi bacterium]|nr:6-phosphofructokinase [Chloroflexota bacterium]
MVEKKRIGILTGGGDCPGLNAAIRGAAKGAVQRGYEVIGIHSGWKGFLDRDDELLDSARTSGIIDRGGTILGTSRVSPLAVENGTKFVFERFEELRLEGLVVLGGEGTLTVSGIMFDKGLPLVGIPKTIDNDVKDTDYSIGFQTAVQIATDALDRLRSTAESHHRIMLLEVMGRDTGWIATYAGLAAGADAILIPEIPVDKTKLEWLCYTVHERNRKGRRYSIVVVAEGTKLEGRSITREECDTSSEKRPLFGGVGELVGEAIQKSTGLETRVSTLGYIQRGGTPVAYDRNLATAFGAKAAELIANKKFGMMTALKGNTIRAVPLKNVATGKKTVDMKLYRVAERFFGLGGEI